MDHEINRTVLGSFPDARILCANNVEFDKCFDLERIDISAKVCISDKKKELAYMVARQISLAFLHQLLGSAVLLPCLGKLTSVEHLAHKHLL